MNHRATTNKNKYNVDEINIRHCSCHVEQEAG